MGKSILKLSKVFSNNWMKLWIFFNGFLQLIDICLQDVWRNIDLRWSNTRMDKFRRRFEDICPRFRHTCSMDIESSPNIKIFEIPLKTFSVHCSRLSYIKTEYAYWIIFFNMQIYVPSINLSIMSSDIKNSTQVTISSTLLPILFWLGSEWAIERIMWWLFGNKTKLVA